MSQCACGKQTVEDAVQCEQCRALTELELPPGSNAEQIEQAYRRIVAEWQPRRQGSDPRMRRTAELKLAEVKAAYSSLKAEAHATAQREEATKIEAVQEILPEKSSRLNSLIKNPTLMRLSTLGALLIAVTAGVLAIDFVLSSMPATAPAYATFKTNFKNAFVARLDGVIHHNQTSTPEVAPSPETSAGPADTQTGADHPVSHQSDRALMNSLSNVPHVSGPQAYVTLGLTAHEVAAVLGKPTSASSRAITYGSSVIYMRDGYVSGWKVDPSAHVPVRLWPHHEIDPDLDSFTTGSTKDQVIFVQGTPTLVTDDKFGYGNSMVYFQGGRVAGWLNNSGSVHLKVHEE